MLQERPFYTRPLFYFAVGALGSALGGIVLYKLVNRQKAKPYQQVTRAYPLHYFESSPEVEQAHVAEPVAEPVTAPKASAKKAAVSPSVSASASVLLSRLAANPAIYAKEKRKQEKARASKRAKARVRAKAKAKREESLFPNGLAIVDGRLRIENWSAWMKSAPRVMDLALDAGAQTAGDVLKVLLNNSLPQYPWPPPAGSRLRSQWDRLSSIVAASMDLPNPPPVEEKKEDTPWLRLVK